MPGQLSITVGIPGSGKTTTAEQMQFIDENTALVSRDDLRKMLYNGEGILDNSLEQTITHRQTEIVKSYLREGKHVIVHDTNLKEKYRTKWARIARNLGAEFKIIDLTGVPLGDCVTRDYLRGTWEGGREVGETVIRDMHYKFIEPLKGTPLNELDYIVDPVYFRPYVPSPEKPSAILVDIDGTVASHQGVRSPYDSSRYQYDLPKKDVIKFVQDQHYKLGKQIVFCSGRHQDFRKVTEEWLFEHVKVPFHLVMREDKSRDDSVEKYLLFDRYIREDYNVEFVLDDRDRVVNMWRQIGLLTLQVAEGDF